jgi:GGDEF domain-containing protein
VAVGHLLAIMQTVVAAEFLAFALFPPVPTSPVLLDAVLAGLMLAGGAASAVFARRLPRWWVHASLGLAVVAIVIGSATRVTPQGQTALGVNVVLVGVVAANLLPRRTLLGYLVVTIGGYLVAVGTSLLNMHEFYAGIVAVTAVAASLIVSNLVSRLEHEALHDPLTGALNRRGLGVQAPLVRSVAERAGRGTSVVMIDLDRFKDYNDRWGHAAGDHLLTELAQSWVAQLRTGDLVARVGGDEFVLVLPGSIDDSTDEVVERMRRTRPGTWSAGITDWDPGEDLDAALARADVGLYADKALRARGTTGRPWP